MIIDQGTENGYPETNVIITQDDYKSLVREYSKLQKKTKYMFSSDSGFYERTGFAAGFALYRGGLSLVEAVAN